MKILSSILLLLLQKHLSSSRGRGTKRRVSEYKLVPQGAVVDLYRTCSLLIVRLGMVSDSANAQHEYSQRFREKAYGQTSTASRPGLSTCKALS
jgi:hypothetical protein